MRFIRGLKNLFKKTLLLIIVILFVISWFLFTFIFDIFGNPEFGRAFLFVIGALAAFTFVLLIVSFFIQIDKMGALIIIIAIILAIPVFWIFRWNVIYIFIFFALADSILIAFFAYKLLMDTSIKVDNYLYKKKRSRIFTRIFEFVLFFFLTWWFISLTFRFFSSAPLLGSTNIARSFFYLFLIIITILGIVLIRLIFTKKLAAYISLFAMLIYFYVVYLVVDILAAFLFIDSGPYDIFSFFIDLILFIYIIGSIYERVDYIKEKLRIFRADTIALFLILTKLVVQIMKIWQEVITPLAPAIILEQAVMQVQILWIFFVLFTLIIGIYTIFKHKEGSSS
ncbi:MAG: hypothetical protein ACFE9S_10820 [Candidatus Hermodarchaeota archaeon]